MPGLNPVFPPLPALYHLRFSRSKLFRIPTTRIARLSTCLGSLSCKTMYAVDGITDGSAQMFSKVSAGISAFFCQRDDCVLLMPRSARVLRSSTWSHAATKLVRFPCAVSLSINNSPAHLSARKRISSAFRSASIIRDRDEC